MRHACGISAHAIHMHGASFVGAGQEKKGLGKGYQAEANDRSVPNRRQDVLFSLTTKYKLFVFIVLEQKSCLTVPW
jgi:hypothetical protein